MEITYPFRNDTDWHTWGRNLTTVIDAEKAPMYGLTAAQMAVVAGAFSAFDGTLAAARDQATRSAVTVQAKNDELEAFKRIVRPIVAILRTNPGVSDAQRRELGIRIVDHTPTPAPVPTASPEVTGCMTGMTSLKLEVRDPLSPDRRGKPKGVRQIATMTFISTPQQPTPPADVNAWRQPQFSGRTTVLLDFPSIVGETTVWVSCAYVNSRNEFGPASAPQSIRLLGKAGSAQQQGEDGMRIAA